MLSSRYNDYCTFYNIKKYQRMAPWLYGEWQGLHVQQKNRLKTYLELRQKILL